jgi:15,16-dihydrobiliverdin:ferredoxin oxidoreductase
MMQQQQQQRRCLLVVLMAAAVSVNNAYVPSAAKSSFLGQRAPSAVSFAPKAAPFGVLRMDTENDAIDQEALRSLERLLFPAKQVVEHRTMSVEAAEAQHGMPWKSSIDPKVKDTELLYMPFWEWQMSFMKEKLTNLKVVSCDNGKHDFSYNENGKTKARIVNLCLSSDEYRKIRLTYYDAGDNTQVFNSVWYPDPKYNLPVLGIDLLAFNHKKYLAIVDFQPLHEKESDHAMTFEDRLKPIKNKYDSLKGRMSSKFYDETQFFSQQMLFARFEDEQVISRDLFPAFTQYVQTHLDLIRETTPGDAASADFVLKRQQEYDTYSAARDPATGLFVAMFGQEWAEDFMHDFLFSMSERAKPGDAPVVPFGGGRPLAAAAAGGPPAQQQQPQVVLTPPREKVLARRP